MRAELELKKAEWSQLSVRGGRSRTRGRRQLVIPVQQFRRRIEPVRPNDGSRLLVHPRLPEVLGIPQRLAQRTVKKERAADLAHQTVVEGESQVAIVERLDSG